MEPLRWWAYRAKDLSLRAAATLRVRMAGRRSRRVADVRVSMTTYPPRVDSACQALESILYGGRLRPARTTLVLSREEFRPDQLPARLRRLVEHGVEVLWTDDNLRSFKKLVPILTAHPDEVIVTADDDVLYPPDWLERLCSVAASFPGRIVGHRGRRIRWAAGTSAEPYSQWERANRRTPPGDVLLTGVGGILYPSASLHPRVCDMGTAMRLCPSADDIWFHAMGRLAGTESMVCNDRSPDFLRTWRAGDPRGLMEVNVQGGGNDVAFRAVYDHFGLWPPGPTHEPDGDLRRLDDLEA